MVIGSLTGALSATLGVAVGATVYVFVQRGAPIGRTGSAAPGSGRTRAMSSWSSERVLDAPRRRGVRTMKRGFVVRSDGRSRRPVKPSYMGGRGLVTYRWNSSRGRWQSGVRRDSLAIPCCLRFPREGLATRTHAVGSLAAVSGFLMCVWLATAALTRGCGLRLATMQLHRHPSRKSPSRGNH